MGPVDRPLIGRPLRLSPDHSTEDFHCGEAPLDDWLRRHAHRNELAGASRTYVACAGSRIAGYYTLATGAVAHSGATGKVRRNMPDPVPVMILGRLAVAREFQGLGLGTALLRDAVLRTREAAQIAGIRAIVVHAISDSAKRFYEKNGFAASPINPLTVMLSLADAERYMTL